MTTLNTLFRTLRPRPLLGHLCAGLLALTALVAPSLAQAESKEPIDKELAKYWDADQAVLSLNNPLYERKGGFEGTVKLGTVPNDNFYLFTSVGGRVGYFITDTVALEGDFSYMMSSPSKIGSYLTCVNGGAPCIDLTHGAQKVPKLNWLGALDVAYSPFHGKFGIFDKKLTSFDLSLSLGVGMVNVDIDESVGNKPAVAMMKVAGHWGAGFRFYLTRFLNLHIDYKQYLYVPQSSVSFLAPAEFTLGVAVLTK
jgi:outer membrane beta-barrel protein